MSDTAQCDYKEPGMMRCQHNAIVGLNGGWYCVQHFKKRLMEVREAIDSLIEVFGADDES